MTIPDLNSIIDLLPPAALYAETHYRFRLFPFSLYFRREPEVIFDAPTRVQPGRDVPLFLLIKDGDRFALRVMSVNLRVKSSAGVTEHHFELDWQPSAPLEHRIFFIPSGSYPPGLLEIDASAAVLIRGKRRIIRNDNHPGLTHKPLMVMSADSLLPNGEGWLAGELHCHSEFGFDQVEFGAPLECYQAAASALGIGWVAITDHSYNLDDLPDNYLKNDPALTKWRAFRDKVRRMNQSGGDVTFLAGEELSCRSSQGRNVHLLIIENSEFMAGTGDGAERWLRTRSEHSVADALSRISPDAFAAAAHPLEPVPLLERLLVGRGEWTDADLSAPRLDGWQILNGDLGVGFERGFAAWRQSLLMGRKTAIFAGNDAHGNLNRFRQVKLPMLKLWEHHRNRFGAYTSRVFTGGDRSPAAVIRALKSGRTILSDGPFINIAVAGEPTAIGLTVGSRGNLTLEYRTSPEFGPVKRLILFTGDGAGSERTAARWGDGGERLPNPHSADLHFKYNGYGYLRAELYTQTTGGENCAFTSPVWLDD